MAKTGNYSFTLEMRIGPKGVTVSTSIVFCGEPFSSPDMKKVLKAMFDAKAKGDCADCAACAEMMDTIDEAIREIEKSEAIWRRDFSGSKNA